MLSISFYDGIKYHRVDFMNRDSDFFGNGVVNLSHFPYTLDSTPDMNILIGAGVAWVDGYRIQNDSNAITLTVPAADSSNPRIDIVQIGHDDIHSQAVLSIKTGVPGSNPVEPSADPNYLKLFAISVPANATSITASNITDRRALVPLNVSGTQINMGGAAGTNQPNTFSQLQTFSAGLETVQMILGQQNNIASPASPIFLAAANAAGLGMDQYGNLLPINPAAIASNGGSFWSVLGKLGNTVLKVFIDGSKKLMSANNTLDDGNGNMAVAGSLKAAKNILDDGKGNMGLDITPAFGFHQLGGRMRVQALSTPSAPTVTPTGTTGSTSYSYYVVAVDRNGNKTLASPATTIANGNATLSAANYNAVSWTAVPGAVSYDVLRGDTGHSIATGVTGTTFNDTGATAWSAYTAPTRNTTADTTIDGMLAAQMPFLFIKSGTWGGLTSSATLTQLPSIISGTPTAFSAGHSFHNSGSDVVCETAGIFKIGCRAFLSGLNADVEADIFIRIIRASDSSNVDDDAGIYGFQGAGGNYASPFGIEVENEIIQTLNPGDIIRFFVRCGEAPRTIQESYYYIEYVSLS